MESKNDENVEGSGMTGLNCSLKEKLDTLRIMNSCYSIIQF